MSEACADGEACDIDGKVDGVCTLGLQGCINVPGLGACTPAGLSGPPTVTPSKTPTGQALAAALHALDPSTHACTPPGLGLPLKLSLAGIKPGKAHLTVTASSGGKRDRDKLRLTCTPGAAQIGFARDVQPIFTARCAITSCHTNQNRSGGQSLEMGVAYAELWGVVAAVLHTAPYFGPAVIAACALKALGGSIQGKLWPRSDEERSELAVVDESVE